MNRYDKRIVKLFKTMNNILHWWEQYHPRIDNMLLTEYPFNASFDEVVFEYRNIFDEIILNDSHSFDIKESNISRIDTMLFSELRDMCELIKCFYKYDKVRFLREMPSCCDDDLLSSVIKWHNANVIKYGTSQQKIIKE